MESLIFNMILMQNCKKSHHLRKYLPVIALWADMFIAYIALTQSPYFSVSSIQGILQILQEVPSFPSSSLLSSFDNSVKLLHYRGRPGCCSSRCISSLITVPDSIFFPFPFFPHPSFFSPILL